MISRNLAATLLLATAIAAQTPPCDSTNDANNLVSGNVTSYSFAGPNTNAWQYTPATAQVAQSMQLFTGNTSLARFLKLEIWSNNPMTNLPGSRITGGTWKISTALGNTWQGCDFDTLAVLNGATPYWIVLVDPGFTTIAEEPGGATLMPRAMLNGANWAAVAGQGALKMRLFCTQLDTAHVAVTGSPCALASGRWGTLFTNQEPVVGNANFYIESSGFNSNSLTLLVLGINPAFVAAPIPGLAIGCMQTTDALVFVTATTGTGNVGSTAAANYVSFALAIPNNPALAGFYLGAQAAGYDAALTTPIQFAVTNGLGITLF
jgi:hypothetical protein